MQKSIEVKPKFLLVVNSNMQTGTSIAGKITIEFDNEDELRETALRWAQEEMTEVTVYKVSAVAIATSYPALKMRWK